jgi:hypothetical protein
MITLQFTTPVDNDSLQIGDIAYFQDASSILGGFNQQLSQPIFLGPVISFNPLGGGPISTITIDDLNPGTQGAIQPGDFLMFGKDTQANVSGLIGYFAAVKIKNNSKKKAEIYCISSGITPSSK